MAAVVRHIRVYDPDLCPVLHRSLCAGVFPVTTDELKRLSTDELLDLRERLQAVLDERLPDLERRLVAVRSVIGRPVRE
jgi:hypothetical protein